MSQRDTFGIEQGEQLVREKEEQPRIEKQIDAHAEGTAGQREAVTGINSRELNSRTWNQFHKQMMLTYHRRVRSVAVF